jgi:hypothetical protein
MFGKYGFEDRVVYVAPDGIDSTLRLLGQRRELGHEVLRLVLAHELVHALQDQHAAIVELARSLGDEEAHHVFFTCIEGHATLVQQRVGAELGLVEAQRAWKAMQRLESLREAVGAGIHEVLNRPTRQWEELSYLQAAERLGRVAAAEGDEAVWRLVAKPPDTSRFFVGGEQGPAPRWSELFAGFERELGKGRWFVEQGPLNWLHLRSDLADLSAAEFETFQESLLWIGKASATRTVPTLSATVWVLRFRDEKSAAEALALSRQAAAREEERLRKGKGFELRRFEFAQPEVGDGEALVHDLHFRMPPLQVQKVRVVWRRRGRDLVRIWDQNLGKETADLLALGDLLLRRMAN